MMQIDKISKEIYEIFKNNNWTWADNGPKNWKDVKSSILSLLEHYKLYVKGTDVGYYISSGRIRLTKESDEHISISIDNSWYLNKEEIALETL